MGASREEGYESRVKTKDTIGESTKKVEFVDDPERSTGGLNPHENGIAR